MDKILVTFYLPTIEEEYNLLIPINTKTNKILQLVQQYIVELTNNVYKYNDKAVLFDINGNIINSNNIIKFSGLTNGCKVILY